MRFFFWPQNCTVHLTCYISFSPFCLTWSLVVFTYPPFHTSLQWPSICSPHAFYLFLFFFSRAHPKLPTHVSPPEFLMAVLPTPFSFLVTTKKRRTRTKRTQNLKKQGPRSLYGMPLYFLKPCFGQHVRFLLCLRRVRACIADHGTQIRACPCCCQCAADKRNRACTIRVRANWKKKIPKERVMCSCQSAKWLKSKKQITAPL